MRAAHPDLDNTMYAIIYGPAPLKEGMTAAEYESAEATRREGVVANEPGCLLYQLVKDKDGQYFVLELYQDKEALDTHFKGMGAKGAIPLSKVKYGASPLQIFPVVGESESFSHYFDGGREISNLFNVRPFVILYATVGGFLHQVLKTFVQLVP